MFVIIIREKDGTLNVVGPFWHETAVTEFLDTLPKGTNSSYYAVTDRDKFSHAGS